MGKTWPGKKTTTRSATSSLQGSFPTNTEADTSFFTELSKKTPYKDI